MNYTELTMVLSIESPELDDKIIFEMPYDCGFGGFIRVKCKPEYEYAINNVYVNGWGIGCGLDAKPNTFENVCKEWYSEFVKFIKENYDKIEDWDIN